MVNAINHFEKLGIQNDMTSVLDRHTMLRKDRRHPSKNKLIVDLYALPFKVTHSHHNSPPPNRTASHHAENISIQNQRQAQILKLQKQMDHLQNHAAIISNQRDG